MSIYNMRTVSTAVVLPPKPERAQGRRLSEKEIGLLWSHKAKEEGHRKGAPDNGPSAGDRNIRRPKAIEVLQALRRIEAETGEPVTSRQISNDTGISTQHIGDVMRSALVSGHVVIVDHIKVNHNKTRRYRLIAMPEAT